MQAIAPEAIRPVPDPWTTGLRVGSPGAAREVAAAMAQALAPEESGVIPPQWLRDGQTRTFRRAVAALHAFRGALVAEPVGTGKTYIALAVASAWGGKEAVCFAPASLRRQWSGTAARLGVPILVWSNALVSRGRLPPWGPGLVIVDESHNYRNPSIRRYHHLARWLRLRPTLLLTATPIVNRAADLFHQLLLAVRDDALRGAGLPSLSLAEATATPHTALGRLVITGSAKSETAARRPVERVRILPAADDEAALADRLGRGVEGLSLAPHPAVAELLRGALWRSLASSLAALRGTLGRYRHLLLHAAEARACQRRVSRRALRAFLGGAEAQLVLWPLLPDLEGGIELVTDDLQPLESLIAQVDGCLRSGDPKLGRLQSILGDGAPTLVFVNYVDTLHAARRLPGTHLAWCSGEEAGIGPMRRRREEVLETFAAATPGSPRVLITTDVLAEGLDLQRAGRVIHFDLPWTAVRLEQRNGRAVRSGSRHETVEILRFGSPPRVEAAVRAGAILARKAEASRRMGIGGAARAGWRWRASLAEAFPGGGTPGRVALVSGKDTGILLGLTVRGHRTRGATSGSAAGHSLIVWCDGEGEWTEEPGEVAVRLFAAAASRPAAPPDSAEVDAALAVAAPAVREILSRWSAGRWASVPRLPATRRLLCRLRSMAVHAARSRDDRLLTAVDVALRFAAGGHTAGERAMVETLATVPDEELRRRLGTLPQPDPPVDRLRVEVTGLIIFVDASRSLLKRA